MRRAARFVLWAPVFFADKRFPATPREAMWRLSETDERSDMLGWFRRLLPREDGFFDLFERHSRAVVEAAEALRLLLSGEDVARHGDEIVRLEKGRTRSPPR